MENASKERIGVKLFWPNRYKVQSISLKGYKKVKKMQLREYIPKKDFENIIFQNIY